MKAGRTPDPRRLWYALRFGLPEHVQWHMSVTFLGQLDRCKDDASRRLLLGVSQVLRKEV